MQHRKIQLSEIISIVAIVGVAVLLIVSRASGEQPRNVVEHIQTPNGLFYDHEECETGPQPQHPIDFFAGSGIFRNTMNAIGVNDYSTPEFLNDFHESITIYGSEKDYLVDFVNSNGYKFSGGKFVKYEFNDDQIDFEISFVYNKVVILHVTGILHAVLSEIPMIVLTSEMDGLAVDIGLYSEFPTRSWFIKNSLQESNSVMSLVNPCRSQQICVCTDGVEGAWCNVIDCDDESSCRDGGWGGGGTCLWESQNGTLLSGLILFPLGCLIYRSKKI